MTDNHDYYTRKTLQRCEILKPLGKLFVICAFGLVGFVTMGVVL